MDGMGPDNYINANYINVKTPKQFCMLQLQNKCYRFWVIRKLISPPKDPNSPQSEISGG
jgi:protein tyrosine phosphatase